MGMYPETGAGPGTALYCMLTSRARIIFVFSWTLKLLGIAIITAHCFSQGMGAEPGMQGGTVNLGALQQPGALHLYFVLNTHCFLAQQQFFNVSANAAQFATDLGPSSTTTTCPRLIAISICPRRPTMVFFWFMSPDLLLLQK
jgi:hypothetical protein